VFVLCRNDVKLLVTRKISWSSEKCEKDGEEEMVDPNQEGNTFQHQSPIRDI